MGNCLLREPAQDVTEFDTPELHQLIIDLRDTMKATEGVGIAAPQIGVPLKVIVFGFQNSRRYSHANAIEETALINPSYHPLDDETYEDWEGCLSVQGLRGLAKRFKNIQYTGFNPFGEKIERSVSGFYARMIQHEIDHINGTLFVERIPNLKYFGFENEIESLMQTTGTKLS